MITIAAAVLIVLLGLGIGRTLIGRPALARLALGNVARRRGESALVIGGSMLATALITGSFLIGESFGTSIRSIAGEELGPIDEIVRVDSRDEADVAAATIRSSALADIDGLLPVTLAEVGLIAADGTVVGDAAIGEVDLAAAVEFGGRPIDTGLAVVGLADGAAAALETDAIVVAADLADELGLSVGDVLTLAAGDLELEMHVVAIAEPSGLGGFRDAWIPSGALTDRLDGADAVTTNLVLVSNTGGVLDGAERTGSVVADLESSLSGLGVDPTDPVVDDTKADLLRAADEAAAENTELFATIGGFSVAAGILLVVNLFVMLAEERTVELGTLRAIGFDRRRVAAILRAEGLVYGALAAAVGALAGIGVAGLVIRAAASLFDDSDFTVRLDVAPGALISGFVIGLAISQLTVTVTSARIVRRNVIASLRQLPQLQRRVPGRAATIASTALAVAGVAMYVLAGDVGSLLILGPVLAVAGLIPLAARMIGRNAAAIVLGSVASVWPPLAFRVHETTMSDADVDVFLTLGLALVALAAIVLGHAGPIWRRLLGRRGGIVSRLGFAHPLARPGRTAMLVSMYALIVFTVTFMAAINSVFAAQAPAFARSAGGDWSAVVDLNPTAEVSRSDLSDLTGIDAVASTTLQRIEIGRVVSDDEGATTIDGDRRWRTTAVDATFDDRTPPELRSFDAGFADADAVWAAVMAGDAVVAPGEDEGGWVAGTVLRLTDPDLDDGPTRDVVVAATYRFGWSVGSGVFVGADLVDEVLVGDAGPTRFYVAGDAEALASIEELFASAGADTTTFAGAAQEEISGQQSFIRLLQGYLGIGLLIGIAGLAVVLIRAVRERRRQLGTMRAIGVPSALIERSFLVEGAFIGIQGVGVGIGLGLLAAWQVLIGTSSFEADLTWHTPWAAIAVLTVVAVGASVLAAVAPARRAGRITPAVALRLDH